MAKLTLSELIKKVEIGDSDEIIKQLSESPEIMEWANNNFGTVKPIIYADFYDNGHDNEAYYCHSCGNMWTKEKERGYYRREDSITCPYCDNTTEKFSVGSTIEKNNTFLFVREFNEEEGYALIDSLIIKRVHDFTGEHIIDGVENECLKGTFHIKVDFDSESPLSLTLGLRPNEYLNSTEHRYGYYGYNSGGYHNKKILSANNGDFASMRRKWTSLEYIENENYRKLLAAINKMYSVNCESLNEAIRNMHEQLAEKNSRISKGQQKKMMALEGQKNFYEEYVSDISEEEFMQKFKAARNNEYPMGVFFSSLGGINKYCLRCNCGHVFYVERTARDEDNDDLVCPECGQPLKFGSYTRGTTIDTRSTSVEFAETIEGREELVLHSYVVNECFNQKDESYSYSIHEKGRVYFTEKKIFVTLSKDALRSDDYSSIKMSLPQQIESVRELDSIFSAYRYSYNSVPVCITTAEEWKEMIPNTYLRYSGVLDAWGLGINPENKIEEMGKISRSSYLYAWYKFPFIEAIAKGNVPRICDDVVRSYSKDDSYLNPDGKTLHKILKLKDTHELRMVSALNLNVNALREFHQLYEIDNSMGIEEYKEICELENNKRVIEIARNFGIKYSQIIEYIDTVFRYQRIPKRNALETWGDYLRMAKASGYILKGKKKYPDSLKKEHDVVAYTYNTVTNHEIREKFIARVEENFNEVKYSFEKLMVTVPKTPEEVVQEGKELHHCVSSYVGTIAEGKSIVCFIRFKEDPDTPYFTAEVVDGVITQVEGDCRVLPTDPKLINFIAKWAAFKGYELDYRTRKD